MRNFTAIIEKCQDTGLYVGFVPGFPGAHSHGVTLEQLNRNLKKVIWSCDKCIKTWAFQNFRYILFSSLRPRRSQGSTALLLAGRACSCRNLCRRAAVRL
jgi:hypothetical protein